MATSLPHFGQRFALRASFNFVRGRKTMIRFLQAWQSVRFIGMEQCKASVSQMQARLPRVFLEPLRRRMSLVGRPQRNRRIGWNHNSFRSACSSNRNSSSVL